MQTVSKSQFKNQMLEYMRQVEQTKQPLIIKHGEKPVLKLIPYKENTDDILQSLRNSVISYSNPTDPIGDNDWEILV